MYNITLYENGIFCTNIGGEVPTLTEAIEQIKRISATLNAEELDGYFGYKFDRAGTTCALIVTDRWNFPIKTIEEE
jgi:hypothetical protein